MITKEQILQATDDLRKQLAEAREDKMKWYNELVRVQNLQEEKDAEIKALRGALTFCKSVAEEMVEKCDDPESDQFHVIAKVGTDALADTPAVTPTIEPRANGQTFCSDCNTMHPPGLVCGSSPLRPEHEPDEEWMNAPLGKPVTPVNFLPECCFQKTLSKVQCMDGSSLHYNQPCSKRCDKPTLPEKGASDGQ